MSRRFGALAGMLVAVAVVSACSLVELTPWERHSVDFDGEALEEIIGDLDVMITSYNESYDALASCTEAQGMAIDAQNDLERLEGKTASDQVAQREFDVLFGQFLAGTSWLNREC